MSDFKSDFDALATRATDFCEPLLQDFREAMFQADRAIEAMRDAGLVVTIATMVNPTREGMAATRISVTIMRDLAK